MCGRLTRYRIVLSTPAIRSSLAVGDRRGSLHDTVDDGLAASHTRGHARGVRESRGRRRERIFVAIVRRAAVRGRGSGGSDGQVRHRVRGRNGLRRRS